MKLLISRERCCQQEVDKCCNHLGINSIPVIHDISNLPNPLNREFNTEFLRVLMNGSTIRGSYFNHSIHKIRAIYINLNNGNIEIEKVIVHEVCHDAFRGFKDGRDFDGIVDQVYSELYL